MENKTSLSEEKVYFLAVLIRLKTYFCFSIIKHTLHMSGFIVLLIIGACTAVSIKGFNDKSFKRKYMLNVGNIATRGEYYRLFTCGFLHADWAHLIFNMLTLYFFYSTPYMVLGGGAFLFIYMGGLVFASWYSFMVHHKDYYYSALGASGAVSAVLFSAVVLNPTMKMIIFPIPLPIPGWAFAIAYVLYSTFGLRKNNSNIGHSAHLGGAVIGVVITLLMRPYMIWEAPLFTSGITLLSIVLLLLELKRKR